MTDQTTTRRTAKPDATGKSKALFERALKVMIEGGSSPYSCLMGTWVETEPDETVYSSMAALAYAEGETFTGGHSSVIKLRFDYHSLCLPAPC